MCISAFTCAWIYFFFFTASGVTQITCVDVQLDGIASFHSIPFLEGFDFFPLDFF